MQISGTVILKKNRIKRETFEWPLNRFLKEIKFWSVLTLDKSCSISSPIVSKSRSLDELLSSGDVSELQIC